MHASPHGSDDEFPGYTARSDAFRPVAIPRAQAPLPHENPVHQHGASRAGIRSGGAFALDLPGAREARRAPHAGRDRSGSSEPSDRTGRARRPPARHRRSRDPLVLAQAQVPARGLPLRPERRRRRGAAPSRAPLRRLLRPLPPADPRRLRAARADLRRPRRRPDQPDAHAAGPARRAAGGDAAPLARADAPRLRDEARRRSSRLPSSSRDPAVHLDAARALRIGGVAARRAGAPLRRRHALAAEPRRDHPLHRARPPADPRPRARRAPAPGRRGR